MKHYQKKLIALPIMCMLTFSGCVGNFGEHSFQKVSAAIIDENFNDTLSGYCFEENGSIKIGMFGFSERLSPIATMALQNLFDVKMIAPETFIVEENQYYFSLQKSLYYKKNFVKTELLGANSLEGDYYAAFKIAKDIGDSELFMQITKKYNENKKVVPDLDNLLPEKIYKEINENYIGGAFQQKQQQTVIQQLEKYKVTQENEIENVILLNSCLAYITHFKMDTYAKQIQSIYEKYLDKHFQKQLFAQSTMLFAIQCDNLKCMSDYLNETLKGTFLSELINKENAAIYNNYFYDINGAKNLALYLSALSYSKQPISKQQTKTLLVLLNTINSRIPEQDYVNRYYIKYAYSLFGILLKSDVKDKKIDDTTYFGNKMSNTKNSNLQTSEDEDILSLLQKCDLTTDKNAIKQALENIDILSYKNNEEFAILLNLYTAILIDNDLLNDNVINAIKHYIQGHNSLFGYTTEKGNYSFESSVYYTNVLNMLKRRNSNGLR